MKRDSFTMAASRRSAKAGVAIRLGSTTKLSMKRRGLSGCATSERLLLLRARRIPGVREASRVIPARVCKGALFSWPSVGEMLLSPVVSAMSWSLPEAAVNARERAGLLHRAARWAAPPTAEPYPSTCEARLATHEAIEWTGSDFG